MCVHVHGHTCVCVRFFILEKSRRKMSTLLDPVVLKFIEGDMVSRISVVMTLSRWVLHRGVGFL